MFTLSSLKDQHLFVRVFEKAPIGMALLSSDGSFRVNASLCNMLGYSEDELVARTIQSVTYPEDLEADLKLWFKLVHSEIDSYQIEKRYIHKSGDIKWGLLNVTVERAKKGISDNDIFISQIVDITEQKKKEQDLKKIQALHQLISEHSQDVIMRTTPDGMISYVTPVVRNQLGYDPDELLGRYCYDYWHPEDVNDWFKDRDLDSRKVVYRVRHKNGDYIWQETLINQIRNTEGDVHHIIGIGRNITERVQTEELIRRSEKLSIIGELAAGIAHEIRNPLTSLRGFVQMYREEDEDNSNIRHLRHEVMLSEIDRINEIVSELLVLAKPSNEAFKLRNIVDNISDVVRLFEGQANLFNVQIVQQMDANLPLVLCQSSIKQVFINILKNAIESMTKGGEVLIYAKCIDEYVWIQIKDQGCGIAKEKLAKIGHPFFTTKENGTGLGLMVSQRIIQNHKGTMRIESEVGKGTTVEVCLPIVCNPLVLTKEDSK